jgi:hypothetical protein
VERGVARAVEERRLTLAVPESEPPAEEEAPPARKIGVAALGERRESPEQPGDRAPVRGSASLAGEGSERAPAREVEVAEERATEPRAAIPPEEAAPAEGEGSEAPGAGDETPAAVAEAPGPVPEGEAAAPGAPEEVSAQPPAPIVVLVPVPILVAPLHPPPTAGAPVRRPRVGAPLPEQGPAAQPVGPRPPPIGAPGIGLPPLRPVVPWPPPRPMLPRR